MNKSQQRIGKAAFTSIPNAYILVSASQRDIKETFGDYKCQATMSFLYDAGEVATEWEPEYGPIQIWRKANANTPGAKEHYYYDWVEGGGMHWSQMAVDDNELPQAFVEGDYAYIFGVLQGWAEKA